MSGPGGRVKAVVDALMTTLGGLSGVTVLDYALAGRDPQSDAVLVGEAIAVAKIVPESLATRYGEQITVACRLYATSGSALVGGVATRAASLLDQAEALIQADDTLGGVTGTAVLGPDHIWEPTSDAEGSMMQIAFTVITQKRG